MTNFDHILSQFNSNGDQNVHSIGYGYKVKNGLITDELVIHFGVNKKKDIGDLDSQSLIPPTIEISGITYQTDVVEYEQLNLLSCEVGNPTANQQYRRPIIGGCQIVDWQGSSTGTLGFVAVDNQDNTLVGVTNLHVIAQSSPNQAFYGASINTPYWRNDYYNLVNKPVYQNFSQFLGLVKRNYPLIPRAVCGSVNCNNFIDAAICTLPSSAVTSSDSWKQIGMTGLTTFPSFATTEEIDSLVPNRTFLYSTGRTTGAKGEGVRKLIPHISNYTAYVGFSVPRYQFPAVPVFQMADMIGVVASASTTPIGTVCPNVINPGDSGSAVFTYFNGVPKIVGLFFAGGNFSGQQFGLGVMCRIDRISSLLNIRAWTGQTVSFTDNPQIDVINYPYSRPEISLSVGGKTYWQSGTYSIDVPNYVGTVYQHIPNL